MSSWKREGTLMLLAAAVNLLAGLLAWLGILAKHPLSGSQHLIVVLCAALATALPPVVHHFIRRRTAPGDPVILPVTFVLGGVGLANLLGTMSGNDLTFAIKQCVGLLVGSVLLIQLAGIGAVQRRKLLEYHYVWILLALALGVLLLLFGEGAGGARVYLFGFLPVEFIKPLLVMFAAGYAARRFGVLSPARAGAYWWQIQWQEILPLLVMFALMLSIFMLARDFGPALTLYLTLLVMLYLVMGKAIVLVLGELFMLAGIMLVELLGVGVLPTRVAMWLSPWRITDDHARHLAHCLWSLSTGGLIGSGIGLGKPQSVPHARSDSVFSTWGEQLGLVGTLCLLCLYALWLGRAVRIAQRAAATEDRLLAAGIAVLQGTQVVLICAGITGLLPMTGMSLPFIAQGNSALLANFAMVGLLYSISAHPPSQPAPAAAGSYSLRLRVLAWMFAVLILGILGGWCFWLQAFKADEIATKRLVVTLAKSTPHHVYNPRLAAIARNIPRGRILDATGQVLAETRNGRRVYPCAEACAQLVGWLDTRFGGPTGAEYRHNQRLRGYDSTRDLLNLYRRKDLPFFILPRGQDVALTISREAQRRALHALQQAYPDGNAAFVLIEPASGHVLVAVGTPTFDPNRLTTATWQRLRTRKDSPLIFRPVDGWYTPGSVFKVVTAAAALESGVPLRYVCRHSERNVRWKVGSKTFVKPRLSDHPSMRAHGTLGLRDALRLSCNLYFAHLAIALQPQPLHETALALGFQHLPGLDDMAAELPDCGFGQGKILASPVEVANLMATVARNGAWRKAVFVPGNNQPKPVLSEATAEALRQMMNEVVQTGTAYGIFAGTGWEVYGKTGTAETGEDNRKAHGWFAGVVQNDSQPPLAFALILEHGGSGRQAARVSRKILQQVLPVLGGR
ncbi:MAG: FtsW/RodA/SpoVE family cell cycle protein [Armatimonadota bacterium]|nr:FtsW/RodA/SpoVE family cell cycle protein [bacterium]MDW8321171.1 FtsW/RodA/SpoVE family cell cycle protein [Armatimonadota bacterium]